MTIIRMLIVAAALTPSLVTAVDLTAPTLLAPARDQGTNARPWFRWTAMDTNFYEICIWRAAGPWCEEGSRVRAIVGGTTSTTQSWQDDVDLPAEWIGERLRVKVAVCSAYPYVCESSATRDFYPLATPRALSEVVEDVYRTKFNWSTVRSADSYMVSFCCTSSGDARKFLVPGGDGGRPLQLPEPGSFTGLQDYSTLTACFPPSRPITWTVAACRDGGCGNASAKRTFCYGSGSPSNAPPS